MFGQGSMAAPVSPMVNAPSIPPAPINNQMPSLGSGGDFLSTIFRSLFDPKGMASEMAKAGIAPDELTAPMTGNKLADLMQKQVGASKPASNLFGGQPLIDRGGYDLPNIGGSQRAESNTPQLGELMNPVGQASPGANLPMQPQDRGLSGMPGPMGQGGSGNIFNDLLAKMFGAPKGVGEMPLGTQIQNVPPTGTVPISPPVIPPASTIPVPSPADIASSSGPRPLRTPGPSQRPPSVTGGRKISGGSPEIREYISQAFSGAGLNPDFGLTMAGIESSFNPNAKNPSGASGLFQFMPQTAEQYGLKNPMDWKANTDAAAKLALDNKSYLAAKLGREPTDAELYLAHQQGAGGAVKLLQSPNAKAGDIVGKQAVVQNGGDADMTAGEFANLWVNKYNTFSGGGEGGAAIAAAEGGTTAAAQSTPTTPQGRTQSIMDRMAALGGSLESGAGTQPDLNLPDAPSPVAPRPGQFQPDADTLKLLLMMLQPAGGGAQIPSLTQLMSRRG